MSDINIKGLLNRSLLHSACYGGKVNLVQILIRDQKNSLYLAIKSPVV